MKFTTLTLALALSTLTHAESDLQKAFNKQNSSPQQSKEQIQKDHITGSNEVALDQDELGADVQELIQEETNDKIIKLLSEAESLMAQTTDNLSRADTSGATIAIPTEIIEKIAAAAEEKSQSSPSQGEGDPDAALLEMMKLMMGKGTMPGSKPGKGEGEGSAGGEGSHGHSDAENQATGGSSNGKKEVRRLSKSSGSAGTTLPKEFHKALDAFNKAQNNSK